MQPRHCSASYRLTAGCPFFIKFSLTKSLQFYTAEDQLHPPNNVVFIPKNYIFDNFHIRAFGDNGWENNCPEPSSMVCNFSG